MTATRRGAYSRGLLGILALVSTAVAAPAQAPHWRSDYNAARREATEKNKPLLVEVATEDCHWCKRLDATTLRDNAVTTLLNERFIPLKIDGNRNPHLTERLGIQSYPTLVLAHHDGKILAFLEGYVEAPKLLDHMRKALNSTAGGSDWMARDYREAAKCIASGENARAIALLRAINDADTDSPIRRDAQKALRELEKQAENRLVSARKMEDGGQALEAVDSLQDLTRRYSGTPAATEARGRLMSLEAKPEIHERQRARRAHELLAQARDEFRTEQFFACLDKCELIAANYPDLPEGADALQMAAEIKSNPDWLRKACANSTERAAALYLALADAWLKQGRANEAVRCLEKAVQLAPGSNQAKIAQLKLAQLQSRAGQQADLIIKP
jgi:thioredoxin-related protein